MPLNCHIFCKMPFSIKNSKLSCMYENMFIYLPEIIYL